MGFPPLIERELRCAARNPRTYRIRLVTGILTSLVGIAFILPGSHNIALVGTSSRGVFWWMSGLMIFYGMVLALFLSGDAIASERREKTLELLRLTELEPFEILMGKLVSTGIGAIQGLLAFSLTLALAILAGGVTLGEFLRVAIMALNCLFLSLSVGLLASSHCRDGRLAAVIGLILLALISALPLIGGAIPATLATPGTFSPEGWAFVSPFTAFQLCNPMNSTLGPWAFWKSLFIQHGLAWIALALAARRLRFHWRFESNDTWTGIKEWFERRMPETDFQSFDTKERKEENPIFWLLTVKYGGPAHRLGALVALIVTSLLVFTAMRSFSSALVAAFVVLISWHVFVKLWVAWVASHLMTEMRRSGMLELTLTTPMDWSLILDGWLIGLKRVFLLPIAVLFGIDLMIAYSVGERLTVTFGGHEWLVWILFTLLGLAMETYALTWLGLLCGIRAQNTTRAWITSISIILLLPWFCVASLFALAGVGYLTGVSAGVFDLAITRLVFGLLITVGVTAWAIDQLRGHLRENLVKD
ncbi:ABC transporter permease subunit [Verrucomicrobia bacterium]|jgi:ABC-type transport system involved in multi-copper enzyme maturation permease subunit|nr:ABC transporter permease subunit [Verrucomicrobiota bacterium]